MCISWRSAILAPIAEVLLFPGLNQIIIQDDREKGLIVQRVRSKAP